jgi:LDH2 family malate/lactate/ureidoglycolate dehydrogenase
MSTYRSIQHRVLENFCRRLFVAYGWTPGDAARITEVLLYADLAGVESHGVQRLVRYDEELRTGQIMVGARPEIVRETPVSVLLDAHKAAGQLAASQAMSLAIEKAKESGVGMVTVRDSNHFGMAGYYTDRAAAADLIGVCLTNTEAILVPTFGRKAMLGTNPIAFAMPASPVPFSFDAATTVVPRGKIEVYEKNGETLPDGWALDTEGQTDTDAREVIADIVAKAGGGIAPLGGAGELSGGHKGYGLAVMVDILCGVLSGGLTSNYINVTPGENGICHFFAAIDYGLFGDKAAIKAHVSTFLNEIRSSPRAAGQTRIWTAGEKKAARIKERTDGLIPVNEKTLAEMEAIAKRMGVAGCGSFADGAV